MHNPPISCVWIASRILILPQFWLKQIYINCRELVFIDFIACHHSCHLSRYLFLPFSLYGIHVILQMTYKKMKIPAYHPVSAVKDRESDLCIECVWNIEETKSKSILWPQGKSLFTVYSAFSNWTYHEHYIHWAIYLPCM